MTKGQKKMTKAARTEAQLGVGSQEEGRGGERRGGSHHRKERP